VWGVKGLEQAGPSCQWRKGRKSGGRGRVEQGAEQSEKRASLPTRKWWILQLAPWCRSSVCAWLTPRTHRQREFSCMLVGEQ
jgi:hypothetical protein